jgi:hypothetical protein
MKKYFYNNYLTLSVFITLVFAIAYLITAPHAVQGLDTGQLVINSYKLLISHPPGYPLFTLYNWLITHILPFSTIFFRAAIGSSLCMIISLLLFARMTNFKTMGLGIAFLIGSSQLFWTWAIIPDVFAMHVFFITLFIMLADKPDLYNNKWFVLLMALSIAHHHTIVLCLPLLLYAAYVNRRQYKSHLYALLGGVIGFSLYLVFFLFDDNLNSWIDIRDLNDLIKHFLRADYGTFKLANHSKESDFMGLAQMAANYFVKNFWSLIVILLLSLKNLRHRNEETHIALLHFTTLISWVFFFAMMDLELDFSGYEVVQRFLIMPLLLTLASIYFLTRELSKPIVMILLVANIIFNFISSFPLVDHSKKNAHEVVARFILDKIPSTPSVLHIETTAWSGIYYLINTDLKYQHIILVFPTIQHKKYQEKLYRMKPDLFITPPAQAESFFSNINYERYKLFTDVVKFKNATGWDIIHHDLAIEIKPGIGKVEYFCSNEPQDIFINQIKGLANKDFARIDSNAQISMILFNCHFSKTSQYLSLGDTQGAKETIEKITSTMPLHLAAQVERCLLVEDEIEKLQCLAKLSNLSIDRRYFEKGYRNF